jgi:hypothetical protein
MIIMGDVDHNLCYKVEYGFYTQMNWMQEGTHHKVRMMLRFISVDPSDEMATEMKMKDLILMHFFLGLEVWKLSQPRNACQEILKGLEVLE